MTFILLMAPKSEVFANMWTFVYRILLMCIYTPKDVEQPNVVLKSLYTLFCPAVFPNVLIEKLSAEIAFPGLFQTGHRLFPATVDLAEISLYQFKVCYPTA